ncbi:MAG: aminodeoxychorismate synthase component I [Candidatus Omnitrophota bacterium]|nr:MAG: aminodeoxychorismate synthase component I [Candidatus Omnitrophota bacterium]
MDVFFQFEKKPLLFRNPKFVISCYDPFLVDFCFQRIEQALTAGYYLAGFFSYETGYCFEEKLRTYKVSDFPLIYLGVYESPIRVATPAPRPFTNNNLTDLQLNISYDIYASHIQRIRKYIEEGDVYQITYCIKLLFKFLGDPFLLYSTLLKEQPVPYPAYIDAGQFQILSLSPEMFIKKTGAQVVTKPMKGTWPRGATMLGDIAAHARFRHDEKNRAENVMIADLLRNDLGRIGSAINAPRLFEVSKYKTLYQMTSTVSGRVAKDIPIYELFASLFPSGSVTGAPKIRAMEIIRELENQERRIYTGSIGYITPGRDLFFNIPIRTLLLRDGTGEMGIGGGIVWDSTVQGEWAEGLLKAKFVTDMPSSGGIIL